MEWYWIALIVAGFIGGIWFLVTLKENEKISGEALKSISGVVSGLAVVTSTLKEANEGNPVYFIVNILATLVNKAVLAAENAWYNNEITKEERKEYCMDRLNEMLTACGVELKEDQSDVVETLIAAACEEIGHKAAE